MTVGELIKHLKKLDKDLTVSLSGYEGGYSDNIQEPYIAELYLNVNDEWYYGEHETRNPYIAREFKQGKRVIIG